MKGVSLPQEFDGSNLSGVADKTSETSESFIERCKLWGTILTERALLETSRRESFIERCKLWGTILTERALLETSRRESFIERCKLWGTILTERALLQTSRRWSAGLNDCASFDRRRAPTRNNAFHKRPAEDANLVSVGCGPGVQSNQRGCLPCHEDRGPDTVCDQYTGRVRAARVRTLDLLRQL
ncbi:hypothetical protein RRG08_028910 [Elysia crispata]|uniref:Uncharacterized protein n=1 Tax=Elysia crispata TaxID=231223 RepID=A0AAE1E2P5_9GAST|nr:hypothetical protein RRG08_028910 [Elysia crispata]